MSFNTKNLKYIKVDGVDVHEAEVGSDKMYSSSVRQTPRPNNEPVFRDNGYQLELTNTQRDYIELDSAYTFAVGDSIKMDFTWFDSSSRVFGNIITSSLRIKDTRISLEYSGGRVDWSTTHTVGERYEVEIIRTSGFFECIKNGVSLGLVADTSLTDFVFTYVNRRGSTAIYDVTIHSFQLGSDVVNFKNFNGIDVYNDLGTKVGEIETAHVDGSSYIEKDIIQKKPFALDISRANSEAILFDNSEVITDLFDMDMSLSFINNSFGNNRIILQSGSFNNASTAYFAIQQVSTGVRFLLKKPSNVALINETLVVGVGEVVNITLKDGDLTMNGNTTSYADTVINLVSDFSNGLTIGRLSGFGSPNMTLTGFTWQGNKYYLTEGLGNEINNGSTKGTIETSHVDGMRRINYGMWLKGNDVDGWTAYD